jgi:NADPH:quinone reductase-like Zn-dependent oxidoreductase
MYSFYKKALGTNNTIQTIAQRVSEAERMQNNYGLVRESAGKAVLKAIPVPDLEDDYVLVRTVAVALNPTDWTTLDAPGENGTLVGCDFAGIVEGVGSAVTTQKRFRKGDRVAGFSHGG